jgi:hypothetical protein
MRQRPFTGSKTGESMRDYSRFDSFNRDKLCLPARALSRTANHHSAGGTPPDTSDGKKQPKEYWNKIEPTTKLPYWFYVSISNAPHPKSLERNKLCADNQTKAISEDYVNRQPKWSRWMAKNATPENTNGPKAVANQRAFDACVVYDPANPSAATAMLTSLPPSAPNATPHLNDRTHRDEPAPTPVAPAAPEIDNWLCGIGRQRDHR